MMTCWIFFQSSVYSAFPIVFRMVFNTALCFTLAGAALLTPTHANDPFSMFAPGIVRKLLCVMIILLPISILIEHISQISLGIDVLLYQVQFQSTELHPGRMSPQTALCFIMCGFTMLSLHPSNNHTGAYITFMMIASVFIIGVIGFAGDLINANLVYNWKKFGRMAPHTAIGFIVLSTALGREWIKQNHTIEKLSSDNETSVNLIVASIFTVIFLLGILFGVRLIDRLSYNSHISAPTK